MVSVWPAPKCLWCSSFGIGSSAGPTAPDSIQRALDVLPRDGVIGGIDEVEAALAHHLLQRERWLQLVDVADPQLGIGAQDEPLKVEVVMPSTSNPAALGTQANHRRVKRM